MWGNMKRFNIEYAKQLKKEKKFIEYYEYNMRYETDATALGNIGWCYYYGYGVKRDYKKAFEYDKKSAELHCEKGMFNLAFDYLEGIGTEIDYEKAILLIKFLLDNEYCYAYRLMAYCYLDGTGVEQDCQKAFEFFEKGAEKGDVEAYRHLGYCYQEGEGVKKDEIKANELYKYAAEMGSRIAWRCLGDNYFEGCGLKRDKNKAVQCYIEAANLNDEISMVYLGDSYIKGDGVEKSERKAVEYYRKASLLENGKGSRKLGLCYDSGIGIDIDKKKARELFETAIAQKDDLANLYLAGYYENGIGGAENKEKALKLYEEACAEGYIYAYYKKVKLLIDNSKFEELDLNEAVANLEICIEHIDIFKVIEQIDIIEILIDCYRKNGDIENAQLYFNRLKELCNEKSNLDGGVLFKIGFIFKKYVNIFCEKSDVFYLFNEASNRGSIGAQIQCAYCYEIGFGIGIDQKKAYSIIEKSLVDAKDKEILGYLELRLGIYLVYGIGVKKNLKKAIRYFKKNLTGNDAIDANYLLGECYFFGEGVQQNLELSIKFFENSQWRSFPFLDVIRDKKYYLGNILSVLYTDISQCSFDALRRKSYLRSFKVIKFVFEMSGKAYCGYRLGSYYLDGLGVRKNIRKAYRIFENLEDSKSIQMIAERFYYGNSLFKRNYKKAIEYFKKGVNDENERSFFYMGLSVLNGYGVEKNISDSYDWFRKGANICKDSIYGGYCIFMQYLLSYFIDNLDERQSLLEEVSYLVDKHKNSALKPLYNLLSFMPDDSKKYKAQIDFVVIGLTARNIHSLILRFIYIISTCSAWSFQIIHMHCLEKHKRKKSLLEELKTLQNELIKVKVENENKDFLINEKDKQIKYLYNELQELKKVSFEWKSVIGLLQNLENQTIATHEKAFNKKQECHCIECVNEYILNKDLNKTILVQKLDDNTIIISDDEQEDYKEIARGNLKMSINKKEEKKLEIFLGSSLEAESYMEQIALRLEELKTIPLPWNAVGKGIFIPGTNIIDALINITKRVQAAVFIFNADDKKWNKKSSMEILDSVRDNVLFEYGLFVGALSKKKVCFVCKGNPQLASDLKGVTYINGDEGEYSVKMKLKDWINTIQ